MPHIYPFILIKILFHKVLYLNFPIFITNYCIINEYKVLQNNLGQPIYLTIWEGSPFAQIEPAMAFQFGLPMLLIRESTVEQTGIWSFGIGPFLLLEWNPNLPLSDLFNSTAWLEIFQNWISQVRKGFYLQTQPQFKDTCTRDGLN